MTSWIESVRDHIVANSLGTFNTDLFIGGFTGEASPAISLAEYGGSTTETEGPGVQIEQPMLQIAARGTDYIDTRARVIAVRALLTAILNKTVQGTAFIGITSGNRTIMYLGQDAQGRFLFSANVQVHYGT